MDDDRETVWINHGAGLSDVPRLYYRFTPTVFAWIVNEVKKIENHLEQCQRTYAGEKYVEGIEKKLALAGDRLCVLFDLANTLFSNDCFAKALHAKRPSELPEPEFQKSEPGLMAW